MLTCPVLSSRQINRERRRGSSQRRRRARPRIFYPASTRQKWNKFDDAAAARWKHDFKRLAPQLPPLHGQPRKQQRRHVENQGAQQSVTDADGAETVERCAVAGCMIEVVIGFDGRRVLYTREITQSDFALMSLISFTALCGCRHVAAAAAEADDRMMMTLMMLIAAADCQTLWEFHQLARHAVWVSCRETTMSQHVQSQLNDGSADKRSNILDI